MANEVLDEGTANSIAVAQSDRREASKTALRDKRMAEIAERKRLRDAATAKETTAADYSATSAPLPMDPSDPNAPTEAAAAPKSPKSPKSPVAPEDDGESIVGSVVGGMSNFAGGFARGIVKDGADVLDSINAGMVSTLEGLGFKDTMSEDSLNDYFDAKFPDLSPEDRANRLNQVLGGIRGQADQVVGEPTGTAGVIGESLGSLPYVVGAMALAGYAAPFTAPLAVAATAYSGSAVMAGLVANENDPTMGNAIQDKWGPNMYTNMTAIAEDDDGPTRFRKHVTEDLLTAWAADGLLTVGGKVIKRYRGKKTIASDALDANIPTDGVLDDALDALDEKTVEADLLDQAVAQLDEGEALERQLFEETRAANAAADEATMLEPLGLNRSPVMKTQLAELSDEELEAATKAADKRTFDLESDENMDLADVDPAARRELIDAQDDLTAHQMEVYRRHAKEGAPEDLASELRANSLRSDEDKLKAMLIADGMKDRSPAEVAEFQKVMDEYAKRSPDHAEVLAGKLEDFEAVVKEAQGVAPEAPPSDLGETLFHGRRKLNGPHLDGRSADEIFESDTITGGLTRDIDEARAFSRNEAGELGDIQVVRLEDLPPAARKQLDDIGFVREVGDEGVPAIPGLRGKAGANPLETPAAPTAPQGSGIPALDEGAEAIRQKAVAVRGELDDLQAKVIDAAETSPADGGYLEATRQANAHNLSPEANEAVGGAATRNTVPLAAPVVSKTLSGGIQATIEDVEAIAKLVATGDADEAARLLGASVYDSTNMNQIATDGNIKGILAANAELFGLSEGSARLVTKRPMAETQARTAANIKKMSEQSGATEETIAKAAMDAMPDANLDVAVETLRVTEISMAYRLSEIAEAYGTPAWTKDTETEAIRIATVLAQVNDTRAGVSSEMGRAFNALKLISKPSPFLGVDDASRAARRAQLDDIITGAGGSDAIDDWIKGIRLHGTDTDAIAKLKPPSKSGFTLGDFLHRAIVVNFLSSIKTATVNIAGGMGMAGAWEPTMQLAGAGARSARNLFVEGASAKDPWREFSSYIEGMAYGARSALRLNSKILANGEHVVEGGTAYTAFKNRRRSTASTGGAASMQDTIQASPFTAKATKQLIKDGIPLTFPFTAATRTIPLLGPEKLRRGVGKAAKGLVPERFRGKPLTDAEIDLAITEQSTAAKSVDFMGQLFETPFGVLAAGDEVVAAIGYNAKAFSAITKIANGMDQLKGTARVEWIEKTKEDLMNIEFLRETLDPTDVVAKARLKQLEGIHASGDQHGKHVTFTDDAGDFTKKFILAKATVPSLRWHAPFIKTPVNLAKVTTLEMNPIGQAATLQRMVGENASPDDIAEATGRLAAVTGINATILAGVLSERIQGSGPTNFAEREMWLNERDAEGNLVNMANSIEVPGIGRVGFGRLAPIGALMTLYADINDLADRSEAGEADALVVEMTDIMLNLAKSQLFLDGVTQWLGMFDDGFRGTVQNIVVSTGANTVVPWSRFWASTKSGGYPGIPEDLREDLDGVSGPEMTLRDYNARYGKVNIQKEAKADGKPGDNGSLESFRIQLGSTIGASLPPELAEPMMKLWQKTVAANLELSQVESLDFWANTRYSHPGWGPDFSSPFPIDKSTGIRQPLDMELDKQGFAQAVNKRFGSIMGVKLTPKQQHKYQKLFAKPKGFDTLHQRLTDAIIDPATGQPSEAWNKLGDSIGDKKGKKHERLVQVIGRAQKNAKDAMLASDEDLRKAIIAAEEEKRERDTREGSAAQRERGKRTGLDALLN